MGEWQRNPEALQGEEDIAYLIGMTENCTRQPATASELPDWQSELDFEAVLMTDPARMVYGAYADANDCPDGGGVGGPGCTNAVSVIIDKQMRVREFGTTYACGSGDGSSCGGPATISESTAACIDETLVTLKELLAE